MLKKQLELFPEFDSNDDSNLPTEKEYQEYIKEANEKDQEESYLDHKYINNLRE